MRLSTRLAGAREEQIGTVHPGGIVITRASDGDAKWWTGAGFRTNATLAATLGDPTDSLQRFEGEYAFGCARTSPRWPGGTGQPTPPRGLCLPEVNDRAVAGLKFSSALPKRLAVATLAARLADLDAAAKILAEPAHRSGRSTGSIGSHGSP